MRILMLAKTTMENYKNAIEKCGAEVVINHPDVTDTSFDGLVLCGGSDIHPRYYGQEIDKSVNIDLERDEYETSYLKEFLKTGKPILGICRGHQLLNVMLGGTLIQDIQEKAIHTQDNGKDRFHKVTAEENSAFERIFGKEFITNTSHHQAIDKLGKGLYPTLYCGDIIEGCEHRDKPYVTVQFHPERMTYGCENKEAENGIKIFEYFMNLCRSSQG